MAKLLTAILLFTSLQVWAQNRNNFGNGNPNFAGTAMGDSIRSLVTPDVVISATKNQKRIEEVAVPISVVQASQIKSMGSRRLSDVLAEQTGLYLTTDHGTGIQLQGMNPEYTLILVDGEPIIGRTAGTLDLTRLAVGNIERIEIVKGPSSALYGSEALGGVINIITKKPETGFTAGARAQLSTYNTADINVNAGYKKNGFMLDGFVNRYGTNGYTLSKTEGAAPTVMPYSNYTYSLKSSYRFSNSTTLAVSGRYFTQQQNAAYNISDGTKSVGIKDDGTVADVNLLPILTWQPTSKLKTTSRVYYSSYKTRSDIRYSATGNEYDYSYFNQTFTRPEVQAEYYFNDKHISTVAGGFIAESVEATRYVQGKSFNTTYGFFQHEWKPLSTLSLVGGGRYDAHSQYKSQFSPKISAQYCFPKNIRLNVSAGRGFKAPDFRQLYLNFTNALVGYSVFGTQQLAQSLQQLQNEGQIQTVFVDPATLKVLQAENSWSFNAGLRYSNERGTTASANLFRNNIHGLIETVTIAQKTNGQNVFSYNNLNNVFTQGLEADVTQRIIPGLTFSIGYQYLEAKDLAVLDKLEQGKVYRRDPVTYETKRVTTSEYGGLFNRSKHSGNLKLFYENERNGLTASARLIYRGRYGFADMNGNQILDADNEYVKGYTTCNLSAGKTFNKMFTVMAGIDNLFNYTNAAYVPTLPGSIFYASLAYQFKR